MHYLKPDVQNSKMGDESLDETELIKYANSISDFIGVCGLNPSILVDGHHQLLLVCRTSHTLSPSEKSMVFELLKNNMKDSYDSEPHWVQYSYRFYLLFENYFRPYPYPIRNGMTQRSPVSYFIRIQSFCCTLTRKIRMF